jgi:hypothetical protein
MAQHDYVIDNQTAPNFRSDLNNALLAIASNNSGSSAPSTTYANMIWYDTANNILKMRNEADDAWINIGTLNQTTNAFEVANLQTLSQATWEAGTSTTEAIVSPAKVKAAIDALVPVPVTPVGVSQSWASASRTAGVSYQTTTGQAIQISARVFTTITGGETPVTTTGKVEVSSNGSTWVTVGSSGSLNNDSVVVTAIVPDDHYYRYSNGTFLAILS